MKELAQHIRLEEGPQRLKMLWNEFREFVTKRNVVDMAVGIIIGQAVKSIVTSLVSDILTPPIGLLLGRVNLSNLYLNLSRTPYASLEDAKAAGAATINYGVFLNTLLDFLITAFVIFMLIRQISRLQRLAPAPPPAPTTKECPYCFSSIPLRATRCPNCTSQLPAAAQEASSTVNG